MKYKKTIIGIILVVLIITISLNVMKGMFGETSSQFDEISSSSISHSIKSSPNMQYQTNNEMMIQPPPINGEPYDTTFFENYGVNPFISTEDETFSTFGSSFSQLHFVWMTSLALRLICLNNVSLNKTSFAPR